MPWKDVCKRGNPAGGKVRQDDVKKDDPPKDHDAGGPSPGILAFINEVVKAPPPWRIPEKPSDFPVNVRFETYPGHSASDVHFEGRAADVFFKITDANEKRWGDWLFDWCVANCTIYLIQGVIFGDRQWFSEMHGGQVFKRGQGDHNDHVHIELNGDGAAKNGA